MFSESHSSARANLTPERWSNTQLKNGFNSSRKLQRLQAMKLHEDAHVKSTTMETTCPI